jgi:FMN-dependent oxidoreductase (nitrilotriacetate monooxygenase family)
MIQVGKRQARGGYHRVLSEAYCRLLKTERDIAPMYHLAWFLTYGFGIPTWNPTLDSPWTGAIDREWMKPELYQHLVSAIERAGFTYLLIEDTSQVDDTHRGTHELTMRMAVSVPKNDPMPLVPLLTQHSRHVGIVPTVTSTFYPPYLASRLLVTLDHLTEGRVGFNLVTSLSQRAAQNYGMDELPPKAERYAIANEWVDVVRGLMSSWEPDAIVADVEQQIYADYGKIHRLDYAGRYFRCRGPLNTTPGPQGVIPMVQAGNSPGGRDITARCADSMLAVGTTVAEMKALRADMHERLKAHGRNPADCKILFMISPIIAATDDQARRDVEASEQLRRTEPGMEAFINWLSKHVGVDLMSKDLDQPVSSIVDELRTSRNAVGAVAEMIFYGHEQHSIRDVIETTKDYRKIDLGLIGSPETVARKMDEMMEEVGGDGFIVNLPVNRHSVAMFCDGVAPILQRRGSIRSSYEGKTFRENLLAF